MLLSLAKIHTVGGKSVETQAALPSGVILILSLILYVVPRLVAEIVDVAVFFNDALLICLLLLLEQHCGFFFFGCSHNSPPIDPIKGRNS